MATGKGIYNQVKSHIADYLIECFNASDDKVDVYRAPFQQLPTFPAITVEIVGRPTRKAIAIGGTYQSTISVNLWIYTSLLDGLEAEEQCLWLTSQVEYYIAKNRTLGGRFQEVKLDDDIQFGTVQEGEVNFLQGAKVPLLVTTKMIQDKPQCGTDSGGDCSCG
ncbi:hypothetical protein [Bacillus cereus]|uniref:hypothetical protein n=1 Tax=Bacillus cereus TaxID=1396 RepID=UPI000BF57461|nr:hypothetical protein [Bacillus cereus]PEZ62963.1 hypothetical protein CN370_07910 [Bacillus cereus]PFK68249.1 hypothetical protein COJ25_17075 [Bacillus cereus]